MLNGCDVSYTQGSIDWGITALSVDFALVRSGYGTTIYDQWAQVNREQVRARGLLLGHWWYLPSPWADPLTQAAVIIGSLLGIHPGEPILLDVEEDSAQLVEKVTQVALCIRGQFGKPPLIYLNVDFLTKYDWTPVAALNCGLWIAHWNGTTAQTDDVSPFGFAAFKQWDCGGSLPGIQGAVCQDVFYGDAAQFQAYGAIG